MKKTVIILSVLVLILGGCSSNHNQKTAKEVSPEKLLNIPIHTTNHLAYCGSDSLYHYFYHCKLFEQDGNYKVLREKLFVENEFPYNEDFKPVLARVVFANETMGHCIVLERPQREIEEVTNSKK